MASYHKQPPGAIQTPLIFFMNFSVNITPITKGPPNMESRESDLSDDMYFGQDYKSYDSKNRNALCNMTLDSATKGRSPPEDSKVPFPW